MSTRINLNVVLQMAVASFGMAYGMYLFNESFTAVFPGKEYWPIHWLLTGAKWWFLVFGCLGIIAIPFRLLTKQDTWAGSFARDAETEVSENVNNDSSRLKSK